MRQTSKKQLPGPRETLAQKAPFVSLKRVFANSAARLDMGRQRRAALTEYPAAVKISHLTGVLRSATQSRLTETNPASHRVNGRPP